MGQCVSRNIKEKVLPIQTLNHLPTTFVNRFLKDKEDTYNGQLTTHNFRSQTVTNNHFIATLYTWLKDWINLGCEEDIKVGVCYFDHTNKGATQFDDTNFNHSGDIILTVKIDKIHTVLCLSPVNLSPEGDVGYFIGNKTSTTDDWLTKDWLTKKEIEQGDVFRVINKLSRYITYKVTKL